MISWTTLRDEVEAFFTGPVWTFLKPFATSLEEQGKSILIDAASQAVKVGEATTGDGQTKMLAALAAFSTTVVAEGLPYIESQARTLIELALQNLKTAIS